MTTINLDLLDALRKLGVDEETARRAAQADKDHLATKVDLAEIKGEITLVKWMVGFNLALSFGILGKLLA
jgi:hypothetical protein